VLDGSQLSKRQLGYMTVNVYIHWPDALSGTNTLENSNPLIDLMITSGFYLHHVERADQERAFQINVI